MASKVSDMLFGSSAKVKLTFDDAGTRQTATINQNGAETEQFLFGPADDLCGEVPHLISDAPVLLLAFLSVCSGSNCLPTLHR